MKLEHTKYLQAALKEAHRAFVKNEVPIGAIVVDGTGQVVGRGSNLTDKTGDVPRHAELTAIRQAASKIGDWRLDGAKLYVTLEPCLMCLGAALLARVQEIHFILPDPTFGSLRTVLGKTTRKGAYKHLKFVHHPELEWEVAGLMKSFFDKLRQKRK